MSKRIHRSHYIRETILDALNSAQPYGIAHDQVIHGLVTAGGAILIPRDEAEAEIFWLDQKHLIEFAGEGETRRLLLSAKGRTFVDAGRPWDKLEVLE